MVIPSVLSANRVELNLKKDYHIREIGIESYRKKKQIHWICQKKLIRHFVCISTHSLTSFEQIPLDSKNIPNIVHAANKTAAFFHNPTLRGLRRDPTCIFARPQNISPSGLSESRTQLHQKTSKLSNSQLKVGARMVMAERLVNP